MRRLGTMRGIVLEIGRRMTSYEQWSYLKKKVAPFLLRVQIVTHAPKRAHTSQQLEQV